MKLRWEPQGNHSFFGYSGKLIVAMVGQRPADTVSGIEHWYSVDAVHTKWITKGYGECNSEASAKRAAERAWNAWLDHASLTPPPRPDGGRA